MFFLPNVNVASAESAPTTTTSTLLPLINSDRAAEGIAPLKDAYDLDVIAMERAVQMKNNDWFSHCANGSTDDSCPGGFALPRFLRAEGKVHPVWGENIGELGYSNDQEAQSLVNNINTRTTMYGLFRNSPAHHANQIDSRFHYYGSAELRFNNVIMYVSVYSA